MHAVTILTMISIQSYVKIVLLQGKKYGDNIYCRKETCDIFTGVNVIEPLDFLSFMKQYKRVNLLYTQAFAIEMLFS